MSKTKKQSKKQPEDIALERYHGPLITNGVDLGYIKIYPWVILFCLALSYWPLLQLQLNSVFMKSVVLVFGCVNLISIAYSFFDSIILKHQVFTYLLLALNFVILLFALDVMGCLIFQFITDDGEGLFSEYIFVSYILLLLLISVVMTVVVYPYFYRRDRRTNGAYREKESKFNNGDSWLFSSRFLTIFGLVVFVPPFLTGYLENVFGLVIGILFSLVIPASIVDAFYAALYAKQHPEEIDEL